MRWVYTATFAMRAAKTLPNAGRTLQVMKNPKNIARHMMRMTTYINANYFNFENSTRADTIAVVKCITCHRGNAHPEEVMNVPEEEHEKKQ